MYPEDGGMRRLSVESMCVLNSYLRLSVLEYKIKVAIFFVARRCLPNTSQADQCHSRTPFHLEHLCDFVNYTDPVDEV